MTVITNAAQDSFRDSSVEVMKALMRHPGFEVNTPLQNTGIIASTDTTLIRMTPLAIAVFTGQAPEEMIRLLLDHPQIDVNLPALQVSPTTANDAHSPMMLARRLQRAAAVRLLEEYSARTGIKLVDPEGDKLAAKRSTPFCMVLCIVFLLVIVFALSVLDHQFYREQQL